MPFPNILTSHNNNDTTLISIDKKLKIALEQAQKELRRAKLALAQSETTVQEERAKAKITQAKEQLNQVLAEMPTYKLEQAEKELRRSKLELAQSETTVQEERAKAKITQAEQQLNQVLAEITTYKLDKKLEGRGQDGFAAFYKDPNGERILVKVDDPATCVLEGSAGYIGRMLPQAHQHAVNFASVGTIDRGNGEQPVSIQAAVENAVPLDKLLLGHKRDPKTLRSEESKNEKEIQAKLAKLSPKAKRDLAAALFASSAAGDESTHTGQFMARTDGQGNITEIIRIDLGARERYAAARAASGDFKHATSAKYKSSGQFGKDYISYYLADPEIRQSYLNLWMRADITQIGKDAEDAFIEQMKNLPPELQKKALEDILEKSINRGAKDDQKFKFSQGASTEQKITELANKMGQLAQQRAESYKELAREEILKDINEAELILNAGGDEEYNKKVLPVKAFMTNPKPDRQEVEKINTALDSINGKLSSTKYRSVKECQQDLKSYLTILKNLEAKIEWNMEYNGSSPEQQQLLERIQQIRTITTLKNDLLDYYTYLLENGMTNSSRFTATRDAFKSLREVGLNEPLSAKAFSEIIEKNINSELYRHIDKSSNVVGGFKASKLIQKLHQQVLKARAAGGSITRAQEVENEAQTTGAPKLLSADVFDLSSAASAGGKTGSMRTRLLAAGDGKGHYYQYKRTIKKAAITRRAKAKGTDRENFGEVIASKIAMSMLNETPQDNNAPAVHLVYDKDQKDINVASRYLDDVKGTLDSYLAEAANLESGHVTIVADYDPNVHNDKAISIDHPDVAPLKKSIAEAIAISALIGDHDVNPGNIMVVGDGNGGVKAVRIDFGHALNDLLNAPSLFGGGLKNSTHPMLDFFNRENVAGANPIKGGAQSKLWRDYPGLIPSEEMAAALESMANKAGAELEQGVSNAAEEYRQLLKALIDNNDQDGIKHLFKSLKEMHDNFNPDSKLDLDKLDYKNPDALKAVIGTAFDGVKKQCQKNAKDMKYVANLMKLQAKIDEEIKKNPEATLDSIKETLNGYADELKIRLPDPDTKWVKTDADKPAFKGSMADYIAQRQAHLAPLLKTANDSQAVIQAVQAKVDEQVRLEKSLIDAGLKLDDVLNIPPSSLGAPNHPKEETAAQIAQLKQELAELQPLFDKISQASNGQVQWPSSTIGDKQLPAFKGTMAEYIDQRRVDLKVIARRMEKRVTDYHDKVDKQLFSKEGFKKELLIKAKVTEATRCLRSGDVDGAKTAIDALEKDFKEQFGEKVFLRLKQSSGYKVVTELQSDIEQAQDITAQEQAEAQTRNAAAP